MIYQSSEFFFDKIGKIAVGYLAFQYSGGHKITFIAFVFKPEFPPVISDKKCIEYIGAHIKRIVFFYVLRQIRSIVFYYFTGQQHSCRFASYTTGSYQSQVDVKIILYIIIGFEKIGSFLVSAYKHLVKFLFIKFHIRRFFKHGRLCFHKENVPVVEESLPRVPGLYF